MTYKLRLLTTSGFGSLSPMEQSLALDLARHAGMRCALAADFREDLVAPGPAAYLRGVVQQAASLGLLSAPEYETWERACREQVQQDPRVRIFLCAWTERAREILAASPQVLAGPGAAPTSRATVAEHLQQRGAA